VVTSETPFFLAIAGLSLSLAGLAGLVAGLRRGDGLRPLDSYRLREIVEFAFANALLALAVFPTATLTGSVDTAVRLAASVGIIYLVAVATVLFTRLRHAEIAMTMWVRVAVVLDVVILAAALATIGTGSSAALEIVLIMFLARPMMAFLFVLASFDADVSG
jgi:hypothetical protein